MKYHGCQLRGGAGAVVTKNLAAKVVAARPVSTPRRLA